MAETNAAEEQDTVEGLTDKGITELDGEALDKALKESQSSNADDAEEEKPDEEESGEEEKPDEEESGEEEKPDEEEKPGTKDEEIATLKEQLEEKERFNQHQGNELGDLRKQVAEKEAAKPQQTEAELNAAHDVNPVATTKALIESAKVEERTRISEERNRVLAQTEVTKRAVESALPEFTGMRDEVAALAEKDGYSEEQIAAFKSNPYESSDQGILINLGKRVELQRQLDAAEKKNKDIEQDPDEVAKKIEAAAKKKPTLKGKKSASDRVSGDYTREELSHMSNEELDELIKKKKNSGG